MLVSFGTSLYCFIAGFKGLEGLDGLGLFFLIRLGLDYSPVCNKFVNKPNKYIIHQINLTNKQTNNSIHQIQ